MRINHFILHEYLLLAFVIAYVKETNAYHLILNYKELKMLLSRNPVPSRELLGHTGGKRETDVIDDYKSKFKLVLRFTRDLSGRPCDPPDGSLINKILSCG